MFAGRLASGADARGGNSRAPRPVDPIGPHRDDAHRRRALDALATRFTDDYRTAVPAAHTVLRLFRECRPGADPALVVARLGAGGRDAGRQSWTELAARHVRTARTVGALAELPLALNSRVVVHTCAGELAEAALLVAEITRVQEAVGGSFAPFGTMSLVAWQGRAGEAAADQDGPGERRATR
ncbi:hypothetical protein [Streptomyces sp. KL116D]|uniref:hypothetical protein n=1 Tax=Streptomyces sp. KL116D TaxID=3045152 RepID=UPI003558D865